MLHLKNYFSVSEQQNLVEITRNIVKTNGGMNIPVMPNGSKFKCSQTSCALVGWISVACGRVAHRTGYHYSKINPENNQPFGAIPTELVNMAQELAHKVDEADFRPETCLINFYPADRRSKLGLHQDNTEYNLKPCIISISLGDDCIFSIGSNRSRKDTVTDITLRSGDVLILHGETRLAYHGVKKIVPGTSPLLKNNGRLNLTIRQVY